jgi:hypothetical protein
MENHEIFRVETAFAMPSLVEAHMALLEDAVAEPRNSMFILVSEACIPLYHPAFMWAQLMSESHISRVSNQTKNADRWAPVMETEFLKVENFQKSAQWSSLTRMHAELVLADKHVWVQFKNYCKTQVFPRLFVRGLVDPDDETRLAEI